MQVDIPKLVSILKNDGPASCVGVDRDGETACVVVFLLPEYLEQAKAFTEGIIEDYKKGTQP